MALQSVIGVLRDILPHYKTGVFTDPKGNAACVCAVEIDYSYEKGGVMVPKVNTVPFSFWGKLAEVACDHKRLGQRVQVQYELNGYNGMPKLDGKFIHRVDTKGQVVKDGPAAPESSGEELPM